MVDTTIKTRFDEIKVIHRGHEFIWKFDSKCLGNVTCDGETVLECVASDEFITMTPADFDYVLNEM